VPAYHAGEYSIYIHSTARVPWNTTALHWLECWRFKTKEREDRASLCTKNKRVWICMNTDKQIFSTWCSFGVSKEKNFRPDFFEQYQAQKGADRCTCIYIYAYRCISRGHVDRCTCIFVSCLLSSLACVADHNLLIQFSEWSLSYSFFSSSERACQRALPLSQTHPGSLLTPLSLPLFLSHAHNPFVALLLSLPLSKSPHTYARYKHS